MLHAWGLSGQYTLVAEHLPPQARTAGNALLSGFGMAAFVIGPLLAGLAVAAAGPALPVAADAASFAILAVAAATVRGHPRTTGPADAGQPDRVRGFAVIARSRPLAGLLALTVAFFFLYGPVRSSAAAVAADDAGGSAALLGLFWTVFGVGATAGSIIAGLTRRLPVWPVLVAAVIGWGAASSRWACSGCPSRPWAVSPPGACSMRPTPPCPPPCSSGKAPRNCFPRSWPPAAR